MHEFIFRFKSFIFLFDEMLKFRMFDLIKLVDTLYFMPSTGNGCEMGLSFGDM